jgi:hypothetical protein
MQNERGRIHSPGSSIQEPANGQWIRVPSTAFCRSVTQGEQKRTRMDAISMPGRSNRAPFHSPTTPGSANQTQASQTPAAIFTLASQVWWNSTQEDQNPDAKMILEPRMDPNPVEFGQFPDAIFTLAPQSSRNPVQLEQAVAAKSILAAAPWKADKAGELARDQFTDR